jgi:hypothetical protein
LAKKAALEYDPVKEKEKKERIEKKQAEERQRWKDEQVSQ